MALFIVTFSLFALPEVAKNEAVADTYRVNIRLSDVSLYYTNPEGDTELKVTFSIENPTDRIVRVPVIEYQLFASGEYVGEDRIILECLECPAIFSTNGLKPIRMTGTLPLETDAATREAIIAEDVSNYGMIDWGAIGNATVQVTDSYRNQYVVIKAINEE